MKMFCDSCKTDKLITDFINNQKYCYRCEYRRKLTISPKKRTKKELKCRICNELIPHEKDLKKRQKTVYCTLECAKKGHKQMINKHWTRTVRARKMPDGL